MEKNKDWYSLLLKWAPYAIILLTAIIYFKAIFGQLLIFDDDSFITNNQLIKDASLSGLKAIFTTFSSGKYNPLTNFSFAIEYNFFGLDPLPYHLDNIILHLLSTWLVFKIVELLGGNRLSACIVSVLFALHPMHVEEVAWASERKDTLYAFFFLWAMLIYLRYIGSGLSRKYYYLSLGLFVMSLLAKSEALTLPFILLLIDWYKGRQNWRIILKEKIPFLVPAVITAALSIMSKNADSALGMVSTESYGFINRIFLVTSIPAFYIAKLFAPFHLSAMHYYPDMHHGLLPWLYYASLPFLILVILFLIKLPSLFRPADVFLRKQLIFGIGFFIITICVMPQLISVGPALTPERYTYIPYIGLFFIIGQWLSVIGISKWKVASIVGFSIFFIMCCVLTWLRIDAWKDSEVLLTDTIEKNKDVADCSFFYWLRGNARVSDGTLEDAIQDYNTALRQRRGYTEAYSNRGAAHFKAGDVIAAIHDYDSSIMFAPGHARNYYNRASGKATIGDFSGALLDYNQFLTLSPDDKQAYLDRGMVKLTLKDSTGACIDWKKAASLGNETAYQYVEHFCK